ncbi:hypothetical protein Acid345_3383 [Candidatus Koribacter versatilis Ellin345]|uniref:Uncharacterized protein n=1 Tax=Koribacter versatilis (strain Ellin345) TaxID=204669 RepID=Q1IL66_KORVE|nr:hypothetical protein [Candidatus Koribacter versatilis]ABF42384.1 hypothetical protein Acid345_3383 [Candidatus Koribacter versatilis Ellin345]
MEQPIDIDLERANVAYADLAGTVCRCCGLPKQPKFSFNGFCYHSLPARMKRSLWDREHYVENYFAALAWLRIRFKRQNVEPLEQQQDIDRAGEVNRD